MSKGGAGARLPKDVETGGAAPLKPTLVKSGLLIGGAGLSFAGIYGAIMLFPRAAGNVLFPFLPEEMRPFASCCSYCSSIMALLAGVVLLMVKR